MTYYQTLLLGAASGFTILLGMPLARLRGVSARGHAFLTAFAVGILGFLLIDIVEHALEPVATGLGQREGIAMLLLFSGAMLTGCAGPVYWNRRLQRVSGSVTAERCALAIAVGLGLHNATEGLAIGHAASQGSMRFTLLLILGFGLHNVTEAFGIVAPLAGKRTTWRFLLLLGVIGGAPNLLGTIVGYGGHWPLLSILFLALAAGTIVSVIGGLLTLKETRASWRLRGSGVVTGFALALLTDGLLVGLSS